MKISKSCLRILLIGIIISLGLPATSVAQLDSEAVAILDGMSDVVTGLASCSFTLKTEYDIFDSRLGLIKNSDESKVYLKAPDKFAVKREGDKGKKEFYYDGKNLFYYSADNNQYASMPAPPTIMETIDSIQNEYGVEFPASDIFYPDLVDEILAGSNDLVYLGLTKVDDRICYHIAGTNPEFTYQVWISNDGSSLPVKMSIVYVNRTGTPQYEALFKDWVLNPELQDSMFDFTVPEGALMVKILKKEKINN